jgi:hypothetical protein
LKAFFQLQTSEGCVAAGVDLDAREDSLAGVVSEADAPVVDDRAPAVDLDAREVSLAGVVSEADAPVVDDRAPEVAKVEALAPEVSGFAVP